jgi:DNA-directed RNA polymerase subunit RPC12/RpoP
MVEVSFRCEKCGNKLEWDDVGLTDVTPVVCKNCGTLAGTYGDLNDAARAEVFRRLLEDGDRGD